jgi:hypothetical protein
LYAGGQVHRRTTIEEIVMRTRLQLAVALAALGMSGLVVTHRAEACGVSGIQNYPGAPWSLPANLPDPDASMMAAGPQPSHAYRNLLQELEPITGLYTFTMTAKGNRPPGPPNGTVVDQGLVSWHADGTETMNSGRPAYSSNFCMGMWEQTGEHTYKLNHYALAWDTVNGHTFIGPANIREEIYLEPDHDGYSGNFMLVQYAQNGKTVLARVQGVVTAKRVTIGK